MDGYRGRDYYTAEEFKSGCSFNYWYGATTALFGMAVIISVTLWVMGII